MLFLVLYSVLDPDVRETHATIRNIGRRRRRQQQTPTFAPKVAMNLNGKNEIVVGASSFPRCCRQSASVCVSQQQQQQQRAWAFAIPLQENNSIPSEWYTYFHPVDRLAAPYLHWLRFSLLLASAMNFEYVTFTIDYCHLSSFTVRIIVNGRTSRRIHRGYCR